MRSLLAVLVCLAALAANAQSWDLGTSELRPAPGERAMLATAASNGAHLAVWVEDRYWLYAARVSAAGEVLDPVGIVLGDHLWSSAPVVASDGEDFVVAWRNQRALLQTVRITAAGDVIPSGWAANHGSPRALSSNGRTYLLVLYDRENEVVLLDRNGVPVSGALTLPEVSRCTTASRGGMWLVACREIDERTGGRWVSAEVYESDFPPAGQRRALELAPMFESDRYAEIAQLAVAATPRGFVSARSVTRYFDGSDIFLRRHGADIERLPGRVARDLDVRIPLEGKNVVALTLSVDGDAVYVGYDAITPFCGRCHTEATTAGVFHVERRRVREAVAGTRTSAALSVSPLGPTAFWVDENDRQLYAARATGGAAGAPLHVSKRLAAHSGGRLVSAAGVHLALWLDSGPRPQFLYTMLSDEGAPLTPPLVLGPGGTNLSAATDGQSFFVLWNSDGWQGSVIAPDGVIVRGPFPVALPASDTIGSMAWNGSAYVLGLNAGRVARLSPDGAVIARVRVAEHNEQVDLVGVGDQLLALATRIWAQGCLCGTNFETRAIPLDGELRPDDVRDEPWRGRAWAWHTWLGYFAFGSGADHRLLVRADSVEGLQVIGDDGEPRAVPYGSGVPSVFWDGEEFLVASGDVLARHAPDGAYRGVTPLPADACAVGVTVDRDRVPVVLTERFEGRTPRLRVTRLRTASPGSGPASR